MISVELLRFVRDAINVIEVVFVLAAEVSGFVEFVNEIVVRAFVDEGAVEEVVETNADRPIVGNVVDSFGDVEMKVDIDESLIVVVPLTDELVVSRGIVDCC